MNDSTGRHRKKFKADSLVETVEKADKLFFSNECLVSIAQVSTADRFLE